MPRRPDLPPDLLRVRSAFARACGNLAPLRPGARLLLACSAGGDSMALLDLAARAAAERAWQLAVAHFDHRQRAASAAEAEFVRDQARQRGLPFFLERLDESLAATGPLTEDTMRQARHASWRRFAAVWQADAVVLAHQLDDCAETLLIRLLAGSGPTGLAGVRPLQTIDINATSLTLVRPLLAIRRADLRAWLSSHGLTWHDDPSNQDLATKRGWVRHELLPLIADRIGLDPAARLARTAELIQDEADTLTAATELFLDQLTGPAPPPVLARLELRHPVWLQAESLLCRQLLRGWIWRLRRQPHPPGFEAVSEAHAFAERARPGAELRTVERLHLVHGKTCLLAFAPEVPAAKRQAALAALRR